MKIVNTDNFGGDYPDEQLVASNIPTKQIADIMCKALNDALCPNDDSTRWHKVVADDYVLKSGFQP